MTGPEHYRAAEQTLSTAMDEDPQSITQILANAQVHATLALAGAIGLLIATEAEPPTAEAEAWRAALGAQPAAT